MLYSRYSRFTDSEATERETGFVSSLTSGEMSAEHAYPLITSHASAGKTLTIDMSLSQSMREKKQKKKKRREVKDLRKEGVIVNGERIRGCRR